MFGKIIPIMSFCGCVGKLTMDSGLNEILKHAFCGVDTMMSGKKYSHNVRAFWLVTEELLHKHINDMNTCGCHVDRCGHKKEHC